MWMWMWMWMVEEDVEVDVGRACVTNDGRRKCGDT